MTLAVAIPVLLGGLAFIYRSKANGSLVKAWEALEKEKNGATTTDFENFLHEHVKDPKEVEKLVKQKNGGASYNAILKQVQNSPSFKEVCCPVSIWLSTLCGVMCCQTLCCLCSLSKIDMEWSEFLNIKLGREYHYQEWSWYDDCRMNCCTSYYESKSLFRNNASVLVTVLNEYAGEPCPRDCVYPMNGCQAWSCLFCLWWPVAILISLATCKSADFFCGSSQNNSTNKEAFQNKEAALLKIIDQLSKEKESKSSKSRKEKVEKKRSKRSKRKESSKRSKSSNVSKK